VVVIAAGEQTMSRPSALALTEAVPHRPEADSFNFGKSWLSVKQACHSHKLLIASTCILTLAMLTLYLMLWPPIYSADITLVAESDKDTARSGFYQNWAVFRKDNLSDEVQMITAAPVLAEVVQKLQLGYDDVYHPFLSHAGHLWTESWPGRAYRKFKEALFPPKRGPYDPTPDEIKFGQILEDFKSGVRLDPVPDTTLGKLSVRGPSPRVAEIANTIVAVYLEQRRNHHIAEADDAYRALNAELQKSQAELTALEERMQQYYSQNGLLLQFEKDKIDIGHWEQLNAGISDLKSSIAGLEQNLTTVTAQLAKEPKDVVTAQMIQVNPLQDSMRDKLGQLELSRKQMLIHYKPGSPEIDELNTQIANINDQLAREPKSSVRQTTLALSSTYEALRVRKSQLETELAGQRASLAVRTETADKYRTMIDLIPEKMKVVHDFDREHGALEKKYTELRDKLMIAAVSRATAESAASPIQTVEAASPPASPSWPKTKLLLLLGAMLGTVGGIVSALLVDLIHGRVNRHKLAGGDWDGVYAIVGRDHSFAAQLFPPPPALTDRSGGGSGRTGAIVGRDRSLADRFPAPEPPDDAIDGEPVRLIGFQF
jgi:uncharacterized protein involved in exopolysaccharide biosynthesis